jgi:dihydroorotase
MKWTKWYFDYKSNSLKEFCNICAGNWNNVLTLMAATFSEMNIVPNLEHFIEGSQSIIACNVYATNFAIAKPPNETEKLF